MSDLKEQQQQISPSSAPLFHTTSSAVAGGGNNRNSTGSTNSSQTSSGFESAKSSSSHHLANSTSSGSCSSGIGSVPPPLPHPSSHHPHPSSSSSSSHPLPNPSSSSSSSILHHHPCRPSSCVSSTGSSTQDGRSSAYFSLSDGLDPSSSGASEGTLTTQKGGQRRSKCCPRVNIAEMVAKGIPEPEIFAEWLQRLCLSEYLTLFLAQGYDLVTLARASPEDLTTLGITRPEDRKRLIQDIQCWRNLKDYWPVNFPSDASVREWLSSIGLKQYVEQFEQQGYLSMAELEQLEAEDLEDIGVQKQGHIKRICLALKKLKLSRASISDHHHHPSSHSALFCSATLRPSALPIISDPPSSSSSQHRSASSPLHTILRRHSQPQQESIPQGQTAAAGQRISFSGIAIEQHQIGGGEQHGTGRREVAERKSVQFRNSSFGMVTHQQPGDRGPPRLNLYRTSQIIAQLPREPPPDLDDDDEEDGAGGQAGAGFAHLHIPPPPAPMPLSPVFHPGNAFPPQSSCSRLFSSLSQPATPRNVQRMFVPPPPPLPSDSSSSSSSFPLHHFQQQLPSADMNSMFGHDRAQLGRAIRELGQQMETTLSFDHHQTLRR